MKKIFNVKSFSLAILVGIFFILSSSNIASARIMPTNNWNFSIAGVSDVNGQVFVENRWKASQAIDVSGDDVLVYAQNINTVTPLYVEIDNSSCGRADDYSNPNIYFSNYKEKGNVITRTFRIKGLSKGTHTITFRAVPAMGMPKTDVVKVNMK